MEFTTKWLEASQDPEHRELLFLLTGGEKVGKPIKEDEEDAEKVRLT